MNAELQTDREDIMRTRVGAMTYLAPKMSLLEVSELKALTEYVQACIDAQENRLVVDFATVRLVNSNTLTTLLELQDLLVRSGGFLKVTGLNTTIREIFLITGFSNYIGTLETGNNPVKKQKTSPDEPMRLGELMVNRGFISQAQMKTLIEEQSKTSKRLGQLVIEQGLASEDQVLETLADQLEVPLVRLRAG